mgnify:CR=1 FL=1
MKEPRILVLMTTYNGRAYVAEQIDSILDQRGVEVTLCICDDCSSDDTYAVLEAAAEESPNVHIRCNSANKGVVANFMDLIYGADAQAFDYFALSDQDDIWYPDKLRCAAARIESNTSRPELYYADVHNIDERGRSLGKEYEPYQVCARAPASLLLVQNWCLGCTTLLNPALVKLLQAHPVYDFGRMYDAWIHAVALYCGGFVFSDLAHAYLDRRITGHNTVGIMNEKRSAAYLAKKALCRDASVRNPKPLYAELEQKMLEQANKTGIGSQGFGGTVTALYVNIEQAPTHIAGLPVAVNVGCHVTRHKEIII